MVSVELVIVVRCWCIGYPGQDMMFGDDHAVCIFYSLTADHEPVS